MLALPAAFTAGLGGILISVAFGSILMARTPPSLLGRVTALADLNGQGSAIVAILALDALQGILGHSPTLLLCGMALCTTDIGKMRRFARPGPA